MLYQATKMKDDFRFKVGWGGIVCILGISFITQTILSNPQVSLATFLCGAGIFLVFLGYFEPKLPLILALGSILFLSGGGIFAVIIANVNMLLVMSVILILIGIGYILFTMKSRGA
jgi:hypothetical protein